jgi:hypothetical protein
MDANGRYCIWSEPINVKYAGEEPLILVQPSSIILKPDQNGFTLSCYAISGTGDNSGIIYAWYYWQKSNLISGLGEWKLSEVENKGRVTNYREGLYRCMVTDMATGKHAWSDIATVREPFTCEVIWKEISGEVMLGNLSANGGTGPYTIKVYTKWPSATNSDNWDTLLLYSEVMNTLTEVNKWRTWVDGVGKYRAGKDEDGIVKLLTFWPIYQVVVFDGAGEKYESDWVGVKQLR